MSNEETHREGGGAHVGSEILLEGASRSELVAGRD